MADKEITGQDLIKYTFTINPSPEDAIVMLNGENKNTIDVYAGTEIIWSVSKEGYSMQNGSEIVNDNITKDITLEKEVIYTYVKREIGYVEYPFKLDENYKTGSTYDDYLKGLWVLLNDEQLAFKDEHMSATIKEVINMELNPTPPPYVPTLEEVKTKKIQEITQYDLSPDVNSFKLNGMDVWLDKATRVGLMNSTQIEKAAGHEDTTLWLGNISLTINCDLAIGLLSQLELYALECYNVTAEHKANVEKLESKEEVEAYDYKSGYPEKLNLSTLQA